MTDETDRRDHLNALHDDSNKRLLERIPEAQLKMVLGTDMCDIEPDFLGFVGIYERLSQIIPLNWTVIDLGCAYAPQAFFFEHHKKYVGVDLLTPPHERFFVPNADHFHEPISRFIRRRLSDYDLDETFAICSYVPPWKDDNLKLARTAFHNVFTFYPSAKDEKCERCQTFP